MKKDLNLVGLRFGRLTVMEASDRLLYWKCSCECGARKDISHYRLLCGKTKSCGCLRTEITRKRFTIHGHSAGPSGQSQEYRAHKSMLRRCYDKKDRCFHLYGGRGIVVCARWQGAKGFPNFISDMGMKPSTRLSLDRIDNTGNYEPGNCRWATAREQARNRRSNHWLTLNGATMIVSDWAEHLGIGGTTIHQRLRHGWSVEMALSTARETSK